MKKHDSFGEFIPRDLNVHPATYTPKYRFSELRSPRRSLIPLASTLSEITGPTFRRRPATRDGVDGQEKVF